MSTAIEVRREGHVWWVGLNRPDRRNAFDAAMVGELDDVLAQARSSPCVLVVHSTTPGMFVAGADLAELAARSSEEALIGLNAGVFERLEGHRWPTIALIDGPALGGGCELALACDLRVASPRAVFGQPEPALGLLAGAGGNWRLPQVVGVGIARRMLYAGVRLSASEAHRAGLADEVVEDADALRARGAQLAATIGERSWRALELTKAALRMYRPATTSFDIVAQALLFDGSDKAERIEAFLAKSATRGRS
jgi:enoyl-CoA hydratase